MFFMPQGCDWISVMALLTLIVDLDSIRVKNPPFQPQSKPTEIEALAHTVIELGGLVNIPIVQLSGIEEYDLISGHLEYFAYRKALEFSPALPDRLTVFIADKKMRLLFAHNLAFWLRLKRRLLLLALMT